MEAVCSSEESDERTVRLHEPEIVKFQFKYVDSALGSLLRLNVCSFVGFFKVHFTVYQNWGRMLPPKRRQHCPHPHCSHGEERIQYQ
jgi:hypothetical protein